MDKSILEKASDGECWIVYSFTGTDDILMFANGLKELELRKNNSKNGLLLRD